MDLTFSPSFHSNSFVFSCRFFVVITTNQETEETSTPTRPVENVVITTKGLQQKNTAFDWDDGEEGSSNLILSGHIANSRLRVSGPQRAVVLKIN